MRHYNDDGSLSGVHQLVQELGFSVGCHVTRKGDKKFAKITGFDEEYVLLVMEDDESTGSDVYRVHSRSFLKKEWKKYVPKKEAVMISQHAQHYGPRQDDFIQMLIKSRIAQALFDTGMKHIVQDEDVQLGYKPNKSVIALKSFPVNSLVLVPVTTKISATVEGKTMPHSNLPLGSLVTNRYSQKVSFSLGPQIVIPKDDGEDGETTTTGFLCPFWFLEYTDDPKEVNMEIHGNLVNYNQCNKKIDEVTIKIPVARNFTRVSAGTRLCVFRAKKDYTHTLETIDKKEPEENQEEGGEAPPKRRRKGKTAPSPSK